MENQHFDDLVRTAAQARTRRGVLRVLAGVAVTGALTHLGLAEAAAACKKPGRKCKQNKDCCTKKCRGNKTRTCRCAKLGRQCKRKGDCCGELSCRADLGGGVGRVCCQGNGAVCTDFSGNACCSGFCAQQGGPDDPERTCCVPNDDVCGKTSDCCNAGSNACQNGRCCREEGEICANFVTHVQDAECCLGLVCDAGDTRRCTQLGIGTGT